MRDPYTARGYVYGTNPNTLLERTAEPFDWFHTILWSVMIVATLAVVAFALFSSTPPETPDAESPRAIGVSAGGKGGVA